MPNPAPVSSKRAGGWCEIIDQVSAIIEKVQGMAVDIEQLGSGSEIAAITESSRRLWSKLPHLRRN